MHIHKTNIGLVGLGNHFKKNILPALNSNKNINVVGFYTRNKKNISFKKNILKFDNYEKMLKNNLIDTIYISAINSHHYIYALKALNNLKNVICEKPLSLSLKDFNHLISIAKKNKLLLFEAFMFNYHKNFLELKKITSSSAYGKLKNIHIKFTIPELNQNNYRYSKILGGGAFNDLGCYTIKMIDILGISDFSKVFGYIKINKKGIDDYGTAIILNKKKFQIILEWGFNSSYSNSIFIKTENYNIYGEKIFSKKKNEITKFNFKSNEKNFFITVKKDDHFKNMFNQFMLIKSNNLDINKYHKELINYQNLFFKIKKILIKC